VFNSNTVFALVWFLRLNTTNCRTFPNGFVRYVQCNSELKKLYFNMNITYYMYETYI
jgi:hypothetical protein